MAASKPATKKPVATKKPETKKPATKAPARKPVTAKASPAPKAAAKRPAVKPVPAASGAAVDAYFAAQKPADQVLLDRLRAIVVNAVPDAQPAIKWGAPFYIRGGKNICSLAAFKEHVSIVLFAPPEVLVDPAGRLEGESKNARTLKVRAVGDIDAPTVTRWLRAAVAANA